MKRCKRCLHPETDHRPPKIWLYTKAQASSGGFTVAVKVQAPTCCWANPLCTCIKFIPGGTERAFRAKATHLLGGGLETKPYKGTSSDCDIKPALRNRRPGMSKVRKSDASSRPLF